MITWQEYQNKIVNHLKKNHQEDDDPSCKECYPTEGDCDPQFTRFATAVATLINKDITITAKAEEEFAKAARALRKDYRNQKIEKTLLAFRYEEEINLEELFKQIIQQWEETGGFLPEDERIQAPYDFGEPSEIKSYKTGNIFVKKEETEETQKGKSKEFSTTEMGPEPKKEMKKKVYRKSTTGPSETLMIHEDTDEAAEEMEELSIDLEATGNLNKDLMIVKALREVLREAKRKEPTKEMKEVRLVSFPTFSGGDQDPIEWLDTFEQACQTNGVKKERKLPVAKSYLKGNALTWVRSTGVTDWENPIRVTRSFVHQFKKEYCGVYRKAQWKQELRNLKQNSKESIEGYVSRLKELWRRIDPYGTRNEEDRIQEFIEGLRPEFIIQVQGIMPSTIDEAIGKAKAIEIALAVKKGYPQEQNEWKNKSYDRTNKNKRNEEKTHANKDETIEETIRRILDEKGQGKTERKLRCYTCNKEGHISKDCPQKRKFTCYNCGKEGHISRNCYLKPKENEKNMNEKGKQKETKENRQNTSRENAEAGPSEEKSLN